MKPSNTDDSPLRWLPNGNIFVGKSTEFAENYLRQVFGWAGKRPRCELFVNLGKYFDCVEKVKIGKEQTSVWKPKDPEFYENSPKYGGSLIPAVKNEPFFHDSEIEAIQNPQTVENLEDPNDFKKILFELIDMELSGKNIRWLRDGKTFIIERPIDVTSEFLSDHFHHISTWEDFFKNLQRNFETSGTGPSTVSCKSSDENFQFGKDFMGDKVVETPRDLAIRKELSSRRYNKNDLIDKILDKDQEIRELSDKITKLEQDLKEQNLLHRIEKESLSEIQPMAGDALQKIKNLEEENRNLRRQVLELENSNLSRRYPPNVRPIGVQTETETGGADNEVSSSQAEVGAIVPFVPIVKFNMEDGIQVKFILVVS